MITSCLNSFGSFYMSDFCICDVIRQLLLVGSWLCWGGFQGGFWGLQAVVGFPHSHQDLSIAGSLLGVLCGLGVCWLEIITGRYRPITDVYRDRHMCCQHQGLNLSGFKDYSAEI